MCVCPNGKLGKRPGVLNRTHTGEEHESLTALYARAREEHAALEVRQRLCDAALAASGEQHEHERVQHERYAQEQQERQERHAEEDLEHVEERRSSQRLEREHCALWQRHCALETLCAELQTRRATRVSFERFSLNFEEGVLSRDGHLWLRTNSFQRVALVSSWGE